MLLQTTDPAKATGRLKEIYDFFPPEVGVPRTLRLYSASPGLLDKQFGVIGYFRDHPRLSASFMAALRYAVAVKAGHAACELFNGNLLRKMGLEEHEIGMIPQTGSEKPLEENEEALLNFVLRAVDAPQSISKADIEAVTKLGYQESDLLDAMVMAGNMVGSSLVWKTFGKDA